MISNMQASLIKALPIEKVILAFDESLELKHVLSQAEKLKEGLFNTKEIFVIYDENGVILKKGEKQSPTDLGKESFETLLKDYCFLKE